MLSDHIDIYCERIGTGFWAEPLNASSNLGFIIAVAFLVFAQPQNEHQKKADAATSFLIALVFLIGVGSGLFHTFAVRWAMWADIIPIAAFMVLYCYVALRRYFYLEIGVGILLTVVFLVLLAGLPALTEVRSSTYVPALLGMFLAGGILLRRKQMRGLGRAIMLSGCLFALSLTFRTLDTPLCEILPNGTHFLWHLLNAAMLYVLIRMLVDFGANLKTGTKVARGGAVT